METYSIQTATLAFAFLVPSPNPKQFYKRNRLAITMFVFAAAVFRSEVALLLGTTILYLLLVPTTSLELVIPPFIVSFLVALLVTVPVGRGTLDGVVVEPPELGPEGFLPEVAVYWD